MASVITFSPDASSGDLGEKWVGQTRGLIWSGHYRMRKEAEQTRNFHPGKKWAKILGVKFKKLK